MSKLSSEFPIGNIELPLAVRSATDIGQIVREQRKAVGLRQMDLAGIGNTGNRLIVDIEKGKPTVQVQKVLDVLDLLGLELVVRQKTARSL
jgi:y4mF family transcriptional regulator